MKTITFSSVKGGVGKSVSSICTAHILSQNFKVLLIDADPNNSITSHFISDIFQIEGKTLRQILKGEIQIRDCIIPVTSRLDFIPSEIELALLIRELTGISNQMYLLYDALEEISEEYDYCIIDSSPAIGGLSTKLSLISSDIIVIPSQLEKWGVRAINTTMIEIEDAKKAQKYINKKIKIILVLPTFFEENRIIKKEFLKVLLEEFPDYITQSYIHSETEVAKTFAVENEFLRENNRVYQEYRRFVNELLSFNKEVINV